jgi:galactokinase
LLAVSTLKQHALSRQGVNVGRLDQRATIAAQLGTQIIDCYKKNVSLFAFRLVRLSFRLLNTRLTGNTEQEGDNK